MYVRLCLGATLRFSPLISQLPSKGRQETVGCRKRDAHLTMGVGSAVWGGEAGAAAREASFLNFLGVEFSPE